jgi:diguanylate cyclase (GGDEF)-like protein
MMKRGKGICAAVLTALLGAMTGAGLSASADAGGQSHAASGSAVAIVADATPASRGGDPGSSRGGGGSGGGGGSDNGSAPQSSQASSGGGGGGGDSQGGGDGGNPQGGTGGRGGSSSGSGGSGGSDSYGSQRSQSGSGSVSSSFGGSQGSGGAPGRGGSNGGGNGNGNSGGNGGGGSIGGQSGRCSSNCHVGQQPGATGTLSFKPVPTQTQSTPPPVTTPATQHPITTPAGKPKLGRPTSTTYSTSATPIRPSSRATSTGIVGLGATVSPALRSGTSTTTGSGLPVSTPGAIANLIGGTPAIRSGAHSGYRPGGAPTRPAVITQPVAQQTFIGSIEQVVPPVIWLALAAALAVGGLSAGWAVHSRHRVRRQAGALAAMSTAALTDQLTGVLNRRGFLEAVERELARAKRYDRGFVLAYVDVRGLKGVNDTEGHRAGDELLKEAASLLQDSARADDVVGRLGGDEMGLLLVEQGAEGADAVRRRVAAQVPLRREKLSLHSSWDLTIGTAAYPEDGETVDDLLRVADLRLYEQRGIDLIDRAPA